MKERRPARVLLVEDSEADVCLMREVLREGYPRPVEIIAVENGIDALAALGAGTKFDLIVLDLNLPRLDGYGFLQRRPSSEVPIVVFSSSRSEQEPRRVAALGAREFVRKPSNYAEYMQVVCGFVGRWS
jgi:CheY-like chemotaxis protein